MARLTIPSDLFYRKMLPAADLDNELEALGQHGVAGSGTSPFWGPAVEFPRPPLHIRDGLDHRDRGAPLDSAPAALRSG
jgi:hypothetical protein